MTEPLSQTVRAPDPQAPAPGRVANDNDGVPVYGATPVANDNHGVALPATGTLPTTGYRRMTYPAPNPARPMHTNTESTLAPTSEFMRYLLAAWPSRYVLRGVFNGMFSDPHGQRGQGFLKKVLDFVAKPGDALIKKTGWSSDHVRAAGYNTALGLGSLSLTLSYSWMVYKDIKNMLGEAVAEEFNKPADKVNFNDIRHSQNRIVQKTLDNFKHKMISRLVSDALFFPAAWLRKEWAGDAVLGVKGVQLFTDTWKRKTTMFEDLITFVNNKINPRNGLGQPISQGEVFDLYQHYADAFHPALMFNNVLEHGTGEGARWAESQPIFQRIAQLMNQTYAYKHNSIMDPQSGHAIRQADFALPKFIYLLGNDLIDVRTPQKTMAAIEIANRYGIQQVKSMQAMLAQGQTLEDVTRRYPVPDFRAEEKTTTDEKNGVIAKGSTMQLERAEVVAPAAPAGFTHDPAGKIPLKSVRTQPHHRIPGIPDAVPDARVESRMHEGMLAAVPNPQLTA